MNRIDICNELRRRLLYDWRRSLFFCFGQNFCVYVIAGHKDLHKTNKKQSYIYRINEREENIMRQGSYVFVYSPKYGCNGWVNAGFLF